MIQQHSIQCLWAGFGPVRFSFHGVVEQMELYLIYLYYCELESHSNYQLSAEYASIILLSY